MTFDRSDYQDLVTRKRTEKIEQHRTVYEMLSQAAVKAEHLTGDPLWDTYLSYIQYAVEKTEEQMKSHESALSDPSITDPQDIMKIKMSIIQCRERILAWQSAMSLPKDIRESGQRANELLDRLPKIE